MKKRNVLFSLMCGLFLASSAFAQTNVYILGSATPAGWDIANPEPLIADTLNGIYTWEGTLVQGEFKFPLFMGDWCDGTWINAAEGNAPLSSTSFIYTNGCDGPDNKWLVGANEAGQYRIEIFLNQDSISISAATSTVGLKNAAFNVFPNPATDHFLIDLEGQPTANVAIFNQVGQEVYRQDGYQNKTVINTQMLNLSGVYFLRVETEKNNTIKRVVFLK